MVLGEDVDISDSFEFSSSPMMDCVEISLLEDMALEADHSFSLGLSSDVVPAASTTANITIVDENGKYRDCILSIIVYTFSPINIICIEF